LSEDPRATAFILKAKLEEAGFKNVRINKKPGVGNEIIVAHYEIVVEEDTLCFIYEPSGCFSFNTLKIKDRVVKVATIDTMLLFLLAFLYADRPYYDHERVLCMAQYLINVQAKNRLEQKGLLKRFNVNCYGDEKTIVEVRSDKAAKYEELKHQKEGKEYNKYFFKYIPVKGRKQKSAYQTKHYKPIYPNKKTRKNKVKNIFGNIW